MKILPLRYLAITLLGLTIPAFFHASTSYASRTTLMNYGLTPLQTQVFNLQRKQNTRSFLEVGEKLDDIHLSGKVFFAVILPEALRNAFYDKRYIIVAQEGYPTTIHLYLAGYNKDSSTLRKLIQENTCFEMESLVNSIDKEHIFRTRLFVSPNQLYCRNHPAVTVKH